MSVIADRKPGEFYLFVKGASEMVLEGCTKWFDPQTKKI
jgi:magnesium-transporting ATPase (P-type)